MCTAIQTLGGPSRRDRKGEIITYVQELLDCHSSSHLHGVGMSRNQGWEGYERIVPCHIYGSMEIIEPFPKGQVNDTHETLWKVSKINKKSTIYL